MVYKVTIMTEMLNYIGSNLTGNKMKSEHVKGLTSGKLGFTLVELLLVALIIGILICIAVPMYKDYVYKRRALLAVSTLTQIELVVEKYYTEKGRYPDTLDQIGKAGLKDPWGRPFYYLNIEDEPDDEQIRKLRDVHRLNRDYDLYSMGQDGLSDDSINEEPSWDDIIRAYNGSYVGLAIDLI